MGSSKSKVDTGRRGFRERFEKEKLNSEGNRMLATSRTVLLIILLLIPSAASWRPWKKHRRTEAAPEETKAIRSESCQYLYEQCMSKPSCHFNFHCQAQCKNDKNMCFGAAPK